MARGYSKHWPADWSMINIPTLPLLSLLNGHAGGGYYLVKFDDRGNRLMIKDAGQSSTYPHIIVDLDSNGDPSTCHYSDSENGFRIGNRDLSNDEIVAVNNLFSN